MSLWMSINDLSLVSMLNNVSSKENLLIIYKFKKLQIQPFDKLSV